MQGPMGGLQAREALLWGPSTTSLLSMRTNQNWTINPSTLGFSFFINFFLRFSFSSDLLTVFLLQFLAFCQASFEWKNFQESVNEERNSTDKQRVERGKFPLSFSLKFWCILVHISSSINPIVLAKVSLERSHPAQQFEHKILMSPNFLIKGDDGTSRTNAHILERLLRAFQESMS